MAQKQKKTMYIATFLLLALAVACEKPQNEPTPGTTATDTVVPTPPPAPTNADLIIGRWHDDLLNGAPITTADMEWEFREGGDMTHYGIMNGDTVAKLHATYTITSDSLRLDYDNGNKRRYRLDELTDSLLVVYSEIQGLSSLEQFSRMR